MFFGVHRRAGQSFLSLLDDIGLSRISHGISSLSTIQCPKATPQTSFVANAVTEGISRHVDVYSLGQQLQFSIANTLISWGEFCNSPYSSIAEAGFRCYSHFEEDGIILYLMTMLGCLAVL
jgi:hypothetical protein